MNQRGSGGEAPFSLPCSPHGLQLAARSQMKKRTSKLKTAKQQTGRCPETLLSPPYRGGMRGLPASVLLLLLPLFSPRPPLY